MKNNIVEIRDEDPVLFQLMSLNNAIAQFNGCCDKSKINKSINNKLSAIEPDLRRVQATLRQCIEQQRRIKL